MTCLRTKKELRKYTEEVLQILQDNNLFVKPEKCDFEKTKVEYLGFVIKQDKIAMDPAKVKGITEWPTPNCIKHVRSFLGFGNFYWKFIKHYSELAKPLNTLLTKFILNI